VTWDGSTADWWRNEVAGDPAYARDVDPLLAELLGDAGAGSILDLGCGDGRLLARYSAVGVDASLDLVKHAAEGDRAVVGDLRHLPFAANFWSAAYAVLVLEHVEDLAEFFDEAGRVVAPGGLLAVVINHPVSTAPQSGPFVDPADDEVLWRWGEYLDPGGSSQPAGSGTVLFHHRPLGDLLTAAAAARWKLERMIERSLAPAGDPLLEVQTHVPRLLGASWRR
jgi:SAM-dependent methyltransferase